MAETPFGRYRLQQMLGRGGMGEVWRAFDEATNRVVAVKVLPASLADDPVFEQRFRREAFAAASLSNPHVVPIHNFGEIDGRLYVDMRLIEGSDLQTLLRSGPLDPDRAISIVEQIASALGAAHRVGLVHRDVKPSNILVDDEDFAYLIDFGIARTVGESGLTSAGSVIGTFAYMAPERLMNGQADERADIYALACVLHECLTGSKPYPDNSVEQQIAGHLTMPPPQPTALRDDLPPQLDTIVAKGMAKDPDERYTTTRELAKAARAAITAPLPQPVEQDTAVVIPMGDRGRQALDQRRAADHFSGPRDIHSHQPHVAARFDPPQPRSFHSAETAAAFPQWQPPQPPQPPLPPQPPFPPRPQPPFSPPPKKSKMWIGVSVAVAVLAVAAIVGGFVLARDTDARERETVASEPESGSAKDSSGVDNSGPIAGVFTFDYGPGTSVNGKPWDDRPPLSEKWALRSACKGGNCYATASGPTSSITRETRLVFDEIDGKWVAVTTAQWKCQDRDVEGWAIVTLAKQPDGTFAGDYTSIDSEGCNTRRALTLTRRSDVSADDGVADPAKVSPRVPSPAQALQGRYKYVRVFPNATQENDVTIRTACLRTGERCISYLHGDTLVPLTFADGAWTQNDAYDSPCSRGGTSQVTDTADYPLPQPAQDPITELTGRGRQDITASDCTSKDFDSTMTRTGN